MHPGRRVSTTSLLHGLACRSRSAPVLAGVSVGPRLAGVPGNHPKVASCSPAADPGVHRVSGSSAPRVAPHDAATGLAFTVPSMHSCPSEPSLPAVAAAHPRCHPATLASPVSRVVGPGRLQFGSRFRTPFSTLDFRYGLSCLARLYAFASQGPFSHPFSNPIGTALTRRLAWAG